MNRRIAISAFTTAVVALSPSACSATQTSSVTPQPVAVQNVPVPNALKVPDGNKLVASLDGAGVQIYQCVNSAWTLLEPAATLTDHGKTVALHFKGPIWVSTTDGSEVAATAVPGAAIDH